MRSRPADDLLFEVSINLDNPRRVLLAMNEWVEAENLQTTDSCSRKSVRVWTFERVQLCESVPSSMLSTGRIISLWKRHATSLLPCHSDCVSRIRKDSCFLFDGKTKTNLSRQTFLIPIENFVFFLSSAKWRSSGDHPRSVAGMAKCYSIQ